MFMFARKICCLLSSGQQRNFLKQVVDFAEAAVELRRPPPK